MKFFGCIMFAAAMLCSLCGCDVQNMSSLPEFSRPYTGEYVCEELSLGGRDFTDRYEFIKLKLDGEGNFVLSYKSEEGSTGKVQGTYQVNGEESEITFSARVAGRSVSRKFPMEKGEIIIEYPLAGKLLLARFTAP